MFVSGAMVRAAVPFLIGTATVAALALRMTAVAQPLGIDQSLWASAVFGLERGQLLYRDVWEQRPPGIYLMYWAAFKLLGWTAATVTWIDVAAVSVTTGMIYATMRLLASPLAAATGAALYAALTMPAWLYRYSGFIERSVCETFIAPAAAGGALAAAIAYRRPEWATASAAFLGATVGAAVVFKPNAGLYLPALLVWWGLFVARGPAGWSFLRISRAVLVSSAAAAVPVGATVFWLWSTGVIDDARVAVLDFNRFYVADGMTVEAMAVGFARAVWLRIRSEPLWLGGAVGAIAVVWEIGRRRALPPLAVLAVLWGTAAAAVILVNGVRFYSTYFINALAPLAVMTAWVLTDHLSRKSRIVALVVGGAMVSQLAWRGYVPAVANAARADLEVLSGRMTTKDYLDRFGGYGNNRGYSARANDELAAYVRATTGRDDRIFLFGINGAGVYFLSGRPTAHRFLRVNFFYPPAFPDPAFTLHAVLEELSGAQPALVIFERLHTTTVLGRAVDRLPDHPDMLRWLTDYTFDRQIEDFTVYRRRAGDGQPSVVIEKDDASGAEAPGEAVRKSH
jgi:hypothetical protein